MKIQKRILSVFLATIMFFNFNFIVEAATTSKETEHIGNIVYFVDFKDSQGNFIDGKYDKVLDMFDGTKDTSLSTYIKKISFDQMNVHNYFPQEKDGKITPYRLSKDRSYYNSYTEFEMISEIISNVPVDPSYNIDMNNDGFVDNAIFVFAGGANQQGDVFWAHKADHNGGTSVNGKKVNTYNVHNYVRLIESIVTGGEGVLAHEFLHSVGYPDLYRTMSDGNPVGVWDIMASVSTFLQFPLAYTRSVVSNWITIDTLTEGGRYTLNPSTSRNGDQAFILKTPLSNKEFFVVEYRKKGNFIKEELDSKIYGSGLIIYRVNTDLQSNVEAPPDYIYVFRPGETEEGGGKGDLSKSFLSKESGRTSYGSSDFSKKIGDGAITYSSGQNSGIVIENVSEAGETISFDVKFTNTEDLELWDTLGDEVISNNYSDSPSMDVVDDKVYVSYIEGQYNNKRIKVKLYDGSKWINLGDSVTSSEGNEPKIRVHNGIPYVMYFDKNYYPRVSKFENNKWSEIEVLDNEESLYSDMISSSNGLYLAYTTSSSSMLKVKKLNSKGNGFDLLGATINSKYIVRPSLTEENGNVYLSYTDFLDGNKVYIKKFINNIWVDLGGLNVNSASTFIKAKNGKLYLASNINSQGTLIQFYCYDGSTWNKFRDDIRGNALFDVKIDVYNGKLYTAYMDNTKDTIEVKYYNGEAWIKEGMSASDEKVGKVNFEIHNGKAYIAFNTTLSKKILVKTRELPKKSSEDLNEDGIIDLIDLALLAEKYNMKSADKGYIKNYDLNDDNIIDIYDIVRVASKI